MNNKSIVYSFEWVTDWNTINSEEFLELWLEFYRKADNSHVFLHPSLCLAWIDTYRPLRNIEPLFCIAKYQDNSVFLPLIIWRKNWKNLFQKVVVPIGHSDFDYHQPLIINESNNHSLFFEQLVFEIELRFNFDVIEINGLFHGHSFLTNEEKDVAPYVDIYPFSDQEEYINSLKTKLRGDIRRQIRRLHEKGSLSMVSYNASNLTDIDFEHFLRHHSMKWPNAYKAPGFHKNILEYGLKKGSVHYSEIKVDDEIISWHLGFLDNTTFYYYMPAINQRWRNYSPGKVHLYMLIKNSIDLNLRVFDFLRGDENYKRGWAQNSRKLYKLEYHHFSALSKVKRNINAFKDTLF